MVLPLPIPPPRLRQVWRWFCDLHTLRETARLTEPVQMPDGRLGWQVKARSVHLSPANLEAWARMARIEIEPWQFAALQMIDRFYVKTSNDPPQPAVKATKENLLNMLRALGMKAKKK